MLARRTLETRIARLENVQARVAPILYMEGACGVRLKAQEPIANIFKHGRASISLGFIGLHETIIALYGNEPHIYDNTVLQAKAFKIVQHLQCAVKQWSEESGYGYSLYATPSENLCHRFCAIDTKEFGVIKGVTKRFTPIVSILMWKKKLTLTIKLTLKGFTLRSQVAVLFVMANFLIWSPT